MASVIRVQIDDRWYTVEVDDIETDPVRVLVDGEPVDVHTGRAIDEAVAPGPRAVEAAHEAPTRSPPPPAPTSGALRTFSTPMPGTIMSVAVKQGDQVVTGDEVCVLEAMKMQQVLRADWSGIVRSVLVQPGQQVMDGDPIVELE